MLSILTKTGPWKIPGDLWRVLRKSGFYCSILEISRKGSLHKGRLLSDDFFELNRGQRRRRKKVLFRNVSSPSLSFDTHLVLLIQAHFRYQYKQGIKGKIEKNHHHKQKKSAKGESRIELYSSYPFWAWVILLPMGVQLWQKKLWVPSTESYVVFL